MLFTTHHLLLTLLGTCFMQPGGKLAMHVQDGSPLTAEVHEGS